MNTSERIKRIFDNSDMSYQQLEEITGVSRSSLQRYANGVTEKIPIDVIEIIADKFNVSPAYLMGWEDEPNESKFIPIDKVTEDIMIPVLGSVPCGQSYEAVENIIDYIVINQFMYDKGVRYALIADGDSMYPEIKDKDIMLIKPTPEVESGAVAIVKVNGFEATCKKVKLGEGTVTLVPYNNAYEVQVFTEESQHDTPVSIIGQVIETRRSFV